MLSPILTHCYWRYSIVVIGIHSVTSVFGDDDPICYCCWPFVIHCCWSFGDRCCSMIVVVVVVDLRCWSLIVSDLILFLVDSSFVVGDLMVVDLLISHVVPHIPRSTTFTTCTQIPYVSRWIYISRLRSITFTVHVVRFDRFVYLVWFHGLPFSLEFKSALVTILFVPWVPRFHVDPTQAHSDRWISRRSRYHSMIPCSLGNPHVYRCWPVLLFISDWSLIDHSPIWKFHSLTHSYRFVTSRWWGPILTHRLDF